MEKYLEKFRGFIKIAEVGLSSAEYQELLSEITRECEERRIRMPMMDTEDGHVQLSIFQGMN
jgi:hypothetical protein